MARRRNRAESTQRASGQGRRLGRTLASLLAVALVSASPAAAIPPDEPPEALPDFSAVAVQQPAGPLYLVDLSQGFSSSAFAGLLQPPASGRAFLNDLRHRDIKVLHYSTPLRVSQSEMIVTLDAPGAGNAFISVQVEF